jgi:Ni/Fe-hydrogenase 1 B-type cytochrome subunit
MADTAHDPSVTGTDEGAVRSGRSIKSVYVYEAPVRAWHWINALAIVVLCATGYLIGAPPPALAGHGGEDILFGYIRFLHFTAAYVFAIGLLVRIYWAFVGNHHARELFTVPLLSRDYWREVLTMLKWYLFLIPRPNRYVGHNPLARLAMFSTFFLLSLFLAVTGFALYGEALGVGSWADRLFGWVTPLLGQSQDVRSFHRLAMWVMIIFVIAHVYAAIREDIIGRQSIVSTMVSGHRTFKD